MNGAQSMLQTLVNNGVEVCCTNPGTSEMHMVAAIGETGAMRSVLGLFEGVCTGAADGYARMAGKPACTLLHLGPGLSNGSANLHNALKANTPVINLIGDHATYHKKYDAPLNSDVEGLSHPISHWVKTVPSAEELPAAAAAAVVAANVQPGQIATLIIPGDCAWDESVAPAAAQPLPEVPLVADSVVEAIAEKLQNGRKTMLLLSNMALTERCLELVDQIAQKTHSRAFCDTFTTRLPRGEGRCQIERLGYFAEQATVQLAEAEQLIVVGGSEFDSLRPMCEAVGAVLLRNLKWQSTMPIDTLRIGVERVRGQRCLVTPVDTVPVSDQDLSGLLACRGAALLVHRGAPGHPVLLGGEELAKLRGEAWQGTLRDLLVEAEHVPSPRPAICLNMNRPEDWRHWQSTGFA